jgi:hypothetical protein
MSHLPRLAIPLALALAVSAAHASEIDTGDFASKATSRGTAEVVPITAETTAGSMTMAGELDQVGTQPASGVVDAASQGTVYTNEPDRQSDTYQSGA